jgi:translin
LDLSAIAELVRGRFDAKMAGRELALPAARRSIRASANAIRAVHRGDLDEAHRLLEQSKRALGEGRDAVAAAHPDIFHAGFHQDAQKEYAEARLTEALVTGQPLPRPDELEVEIAPYLNGMAETIGEGRRAILDLLRRGEFDEGERILEAMDEMYALLVSVDYPDAITGNLRRSTDVARGLLERTRGDLSVALVQRNLQGALERLAKDVTGNLEPD